MPIDPNGLECPCGSRGCFDLYAPGTAPLNTMRADMAAGKESRVFDLTGNDGGKISGRRLDEGPR